MKRGVWRLYDGRLAVLSGMIRIQTDLRVVWYTIE
jgi:hypothetical protein